MAALDRLLRRGPEMGDDSPTGGLVDLAPLVVSFARTGTGVYHVSSVSIILPGPS